MVSILFKWLLFFSFNGNTGMANEKMGSVTLHPIYVSVTELEHNALEKTLEISCKIFTDDFEKVLRQNYKASVDLLKPKDKAAMDKLVADYVQKHLMVSIDGKKTELEFLGYEQQEEGIISYYQVKNIATVKKVVVFNNLLYEYKKEQMGIMHCTVNGNRKSTRLNNPDNTCIFQY